jgi:hypothetical protein
MGQPTLSGRRPDRIDPGPHAWVVGAMKKVSGMSSVETSTASAHQDCREAPRAALQPRAITAS